MNELSERELLERGLHHYGLGELRQAAQSWLQLLKQAPGHVDAEKYLAYLKEQNPELVATLQAGAEAEAAAAAKAAAAATAAAPSEAPVAQEAAPAPAPTTGDAPTEIVRPSQHDDWASAIPEEPVSDAAPRALAPPVGDPFDLLFNRGTATTVVDKRPPPKDPLLAGAEELHGLGDYEGALELIRKAEATVTGPPPAGLVELKHGCEGMLLKMSEARIGPLSLVPKLMIKTGDLVWLNLDHRAGFVLSQVDGRVSFEEIFALSGMDRLDTARILAQLLRDQVIGV
jgi:hypothetical protein